MTQQRPSSKAPDPTNGARQAHRSDSGSLLHTTPSHPTLHYQTIAKLFLISGERREKRIGGGWLADPGGPKRHGDTAHLALHDASDAGHVLALNTRLGWPFLHGNLPPP